MLAGKIEEDIRLTTFNRLEITLQVVVNWKPLAASVVLLLELLPAESTELGFDNLRGSFARICLSIVGIVEFAANCKPGVSGTKMDMGWKGN